MAGGKARSCAAAVVVAGARVAVAVAAAAVVDGNAGRAAAPGACVRVAGDALVPGVAVVGKVEHCIAADADAGNLQGQMRSLDASQFPLAVLQKQMALQSTLAGSGYNFHSQLHVVFQS